MSEDTDKNNELVLIDFNTDVAIDLDKLDEEWLMQPQLFHKYNEIAADAILDKDDSKNDLEVTKAQVEKNIRAAPKEYGIEKVTEKVIAAEVTLSDEVQEATKALNKAIHRVNIINGGAVRSFEHKKKALENLVTLFVSNYFSGPSEPKVIKGGKRLLKEKTGQKSQEQRAGLNKKRRRRKSE